MILVVGATGQLGSLIVRELGRQGRPVRAMVRPPDAGRDLAEAGAELVTADLLSPETLDDALRGVRAVIGTANVVAPTHRGDSHSRPGRRGRAVRLCQRPGNPAGPCRADDPGQAPSGGAARCVGHVLRVSADAAVHRGLARPRRQLRPAARRAAGDGGTALRLPAPLPPSQRAHRGGPGPDGAAGVGVDAQRLHLHARPARVLVAAVDATEFTGPLDVGGPEVLTWTDVARVFADVLGRPVRIRTTPVAVFTAGQLVLARVAPSASNVMGLNRLLATSETPWDTSEVTRRLGVHPLRTVEQVLREKAALPAD